MSTRANIVLKETYSYQDEKKKTVTVTEQLIFYRHSDGYPEGTLPTLNIFMDWLKRGKIRNNVSQAGGWLVILGAIEYGTIPVFEKEISESVYSNGYGKLETIKEPKGWKASAYEPTTNIHGDIEYLYEIDLTNKTLIIKKVHVENWETGRQSFTEITA